MCMSPLRKVPDVSTTARVLSSILGRNAEFASASSLAERAARVDPRVQEEAMMSIERRSLLAAVPAALAVFAAGGGASKGRTTAEAQAAYKALERVLVERRDALKAEHSRSDALTRRVVDVQLAALRHELASVRAQLAPGKGRSV